MSLTNRAIALRLQLVIAFSFLASSCNQYDYVSPGPGIIEVCLKAKNSRTNIIPFTGGDSNYLPLVLRSLNLIQGGDVRLPIFADLYAIRRDPDGDTYNGLNTRARDSSLIIGQAYAPPGTYTGIEFTMEWGGIIQIATGFYPSLIAIQNPYPPPPTYNRVEPISVRVEEGKKTRVILTVDLDVSLVRIEEWFELHPRFFVSSIKNF